jgi:hypothetical protein
LRGDGTMLGDHEIAILGGRKYYEIPNRRPQRLSGRRGGWWVVCVGPLVGSGDHNKAPNIGGSRTNPDQAVSAARNFWIVSTPTKLISSQPHPRTLRCIRHPFTGQRTFTMVPKPQGTAVQSVTHRPLPPLPKLRVRRPNKPEANPCLGAMSSVLGM